MNNIDLNFDMQLFGDRLLVVPDVVEEKTETGIIIPKGFGKDEKQMQGTIVLVGPGTSEKPIAPELIGKRIMFSQYAGSRMKINGKMFLILRETDIFATFTGDITVETVDTL